MSKHFLTMKELDERLKSMQGKEIEVTKMEQKDLDVVHIVLDKVTYDKDIFRLDDYEARYTLELHGVGTIETDKGNAVPLPSPVYEIPLDHKTMREWDGDELVISTERGVYKIVVV